MIILDIICIIRLCRNGLTTNCDGTQRNTEEWKCCMYHQKISGYPTLFFITSKYLRPDSFLTRTSSFPRMMIMQYTISAWSDHSVSRLYFWSSADGNYEVTLMTKATLKYTGEVFWKPPAIYKSSCEINVEYFPFDEQSCIMKFGSWTYNGVQVHKQLFFYIVVTPQST